MNQEKPALTILECGLLATIQDRGRRDVAKMGVSGSGFADWLSARAANRLTGNQQGAALIETTLTGFAFTALQTMCIAVTGAQAKLTVSGSERPLWQSTRVREGADVRLGPAERGLRSYIAFWGGIAVAPVFGSASNDLTAGFGGVTARALARGDSLSLHEAGQGLPERNAAIAASARPYWRQPALLRAVRGPHASRFSDEDFEFLQRQAYRVSPRSSRQGIRLEGRGLVRSSGFDVLSCGVCAGCVQLSSDGLPILLLAEHQTTGGYAVPMVVITADLPDAAQLRPGDHVRFKLVPQSEAALALTEKGRALTEPLQDADASG